MSDILSQLTNATKNHPFLAEAIPTIAGAMLMARRGPNGQPTTIGAPLGAGLFAGGQVLGQFGTYQANLQQKQLEEQKAQFQNNQLAKTLGPTALPSIQAGPPSPPLSLQDYLQQGGDVNKYRALHPIAKDSAWEDIKAQYPNLPPDQQLAKMREAGRPPVKAPATEAEKLDFYTKEKQIAARFKTPPKSIAQIAAEASARTSGTFSALEGLPISRWNPRVAVLSNDPSLRLLPTGTNKDIAAGKGVPVFVSDVKQLRQAETAKAALNGLASTIDSSLPKDPGVLSASGALGRKLTEVVNPNKLAKFNAAKLAAADAFIRAVTGRGNQAQFNAAMQDIVGPHATASSAHAAIQQASKTLDDIKDELTSRAGTSLTTLPPIVGAPEAAPETPSEAEEPPPPGYE